MNTKIEKQQNEEVENIWKIITTREGMQPIDKNQVRNGDILLARSDITGHEVFTIGVHANGTLITHPAASTTSPHLNWDEAFWIGHVDAWQGRLSVDKVKQLIKTLYKDFLEEVIYLEDFKVEGATDLIAKLDREPFQFFILNGEALSEIKSPKNLFRVRYDLM